MVPKGKRTFYPGKEQKAVTTNITHELREVLERVEKRIKAAGIDISRSDVMEHSARRSFGLPVNPELDVLLAGE